MKHFSNIILDLGGVIFDLDYQRTVTAFREMGIHSFDNLYAKIKQDVVFDLFEKGHVSPDEFCSRLREQAEIECTNEMIINAWNSMLIGVPDENFHLLEQLKQRYRLFLLSNTNEIHLAEVKRMISENNKVELSSFFEQDYYSNIIGKRKPDPEAFIHILEEHGLNPNETVFIDDLTANLGGASLAGIHTLHKPASISFKDFLHEHGLLD